MILADIERAKEIIDEVISRDEFNRAPGDQVDTSWLRKLIDKLREWLESIMDKISEWLDGLFRKLGINLGGGNGGAGITAFARIAVFVLIGVLVVVAAIVIIKLLRRRSERKLAAEDDEELLNYASDPDAALRLAEQFREAGDNRMAYRYLFINLLTELNRRELIQIARYKTNRLYLKEATAGIAAKALPEGTAELLSPFFPAFNRVWYGGKAMTGEKLDGFFRDRVLLLELLGGSVQAGETAPGANAGPDGIGTRRQQLRKVRRKGGADNG